MKAKIVGVIGVLGYIAFSMIEFWKLCAAGEYMSAGFALCGMTWSSNSNRQYRGVGQEVARLAHNQEVDGSNPSSATNASGNASCVLLAMPVPIAPQANGIPKPF